MPVKRRKGKARDVCPSNFDEDRPISRERWSRWREKLLANCHPGKRPPEWWAYESPVPRSPDFDLPESIQLYEIGELRPDEIEALLPLWRTHYDRAQAPGFSYCSGYDTAQRSGVWLKGAAARRALYKWAGIPPDVVKRWDGERGLR
jgi:hypothetical protein